MNTDLEKKLKNYQPNETVSKLVHETPILLLVGPSGAGKDAIKSKLLETGRFHHIISHTTRHPRINNGELEKDGLSYHFINKDQANKMLDDKTFIEAKIYSGNVYGTSVAEIQAAHDEGKIAMTDIEVQGVAEYKAIDSNVLAVFILPPDFETWQHRLKLRYGEVVDAVDYRRRLETALKEIHELLNTDYFVAIINDDFDAVIKNIENVIQTPSHISKVDKEAREIAKRIAEDIKKYLSENA